MFDERSTDWANTLIVLAFVENAHSALSSIRTDKIRQGEDDKPLSNSPIVGVWNSSKWMVSIRTALLGLLKSQKANRLTVFSVRSHANQADYQQTEPANRFAIYEINSWLIAVWRLARQTNLEPNSSKIRWLFLPFCFNTVQRRV